LLGTIAEEITMTIPHTLFATALAVSTLLAVSSVSATDPVSPLPEACRSTVTDNATNMGSMDMGATSSSDSAAMDQAHRDLMAGMDAMDAGMAKGMLAANLDVAFICGMIPHHQGAIDMAKAELAHGTDPFARQLAQDIIASQQTQIDEMRDWLAKRPK
jgi:uncharacterized protein (DUF305 family)